MVEPLSIAKITKAMIKEATKTKIAEFCNSPQVGQLTFAVISSYDSLINSTTLAIFKLLVDYCK